MKKEKMLIRASGKIMGAMLTGLLLLSQMGTVQAQTLQLTPGIDYTVGNYAYTAPLRKFVDKLPGLTAANANSLGQYIPVAVPNTPYGNPYPGSDYYEIGLVEYVEQMHQDLPPTGTKLRGYVQLVPASYPGAVPLDIAHGLTQNIVDRSGNQLYAADKPHYLGPTIIAKTQWPVRLKFTNLLPVGSAGKLFLPTDDTIPGAGDGPKQIGTDPTGAPIYEQFTQNRAVIHLHGGFPGWQSDGTPHQWITPAGEATSYKRGQDAINVSDMPDPGEGSMTYYFPNLQSGRLLWYHDHAYGATGPNVYSGQAAPYLVVESQEETALAAAGVPGCLYAGPSATSDLEHLITMVIQDKSFVPDTNTLANQDPNWLTDVQDGMTGQAPAEGNLWFPHVYVPNQWPGNPDGSGSNGKGRWDYGPWFWPPWIVNTPYPPQVSHTPEAFMDTPVINGQPYPYMDVKPTKYRIKLLNASDDRYWNLQMYVASQIITNIAIVDGGSGYDPMNPPLVTISGGGGRGATATASVDPLTGAVNGIALDIVGSGYTNAPTVTIDPPAANTGGTQATATAELYSDLTEVGMVPASPNMGIQFPVTWRTQTPGFTPDILDSRIGGVPDPSRRGPAFVRIANECGILPNPVVLANSPVGYEQNKKNIVVLNVKEHTLFLAPAERAEVVVDFSKFAGQTIIVYNDAPAPLPAGDPRCDLFTGNLDFTDAGGSATVMAGVGPNTRTVMQFRVAAADATTPNADSSMVPDYFDQNLVTALADSSVGMPAVFAATQPTPIVPEADYSSIGYIGGSTANTYSTIQANSLTFIPYGQNTPVTYPMQPKCIQELFDDQGRLNATLGTEVPFTRNAVQTTVPLNYVDPITEIFNDGDVQLWKVTHNGVDSHGVHFHLVNVQIVNRVGWDGQISPPNPDEMGWKETVRMNPLEDIIVATRAVSVPLPFGETNSWRYLAPSHPPGSPLGFSNWDPLTGNAFATPTTNSWNNFNWAYIWHCHLLGHEENDMMRPISMVVTSTVPDAPGLGCTARGGSATLQWTDGTPYNYATGQPVTTLGNPKNEIGFMIDRAYTYVNLTNIVGTNITTSTNITITTRNGVSRTNTTILKATNYVKTVAFTPVFTNYTKVPANFVTFVDTAPLFPNGTNAYRVTAYNTAGSSSSPAVSIFVPQPPPIPGNLAATSTNYAKVALTWTLGSGATGVVLQRSTNGITFANLVNLAAANTSYADTAVLPLTKYYYRAYTTNSTAISGFSTVASATTPIAPPPTPTGLAALGSFAGPVSLTWNNPASAASNAPVSFEVHRSTAGGAYVSLATIPGTSVAAYTDATSVYGTTYSYQVRTINAGGSSAFSAAASAIWPPSAPSNLIVVSSNYNSVNLAWTLGNYQTSQVLQRAVNGGVFNTLATIAANAVSYADTTVAPTNTYSYQLVGVNLAGVSAAAGPVTVTTPVAPPLPAAPSGLVARVSGMNPPTVALTWGNNANNATSFTIQRRIGAGAFVTLTNIVGANVTSFTDTAVIRGSAYAYQVQALNANGGSAFSPTASVTANITFVQSAVSAVTSAATSVTTSAMAASQVAGDLNIVVVSWKNNNATITSVVDNKGKTYTLAGTMTSTTTGPQVRQAIYYTTALAGAGTAVTVNFSAAATNNVVVLEYAGVSTLDRFGGATGTSSTASASATGNSTAANELVLGACATTTTATAGTGFTSRVATATGLVEDRLLLTSGAVSATATISGTSNTRQWVIQGASFR